MTNQIDSAAKLSIYGATSAIGILLVCVVWICGGNLVYSLDDPYIHLELASHIADGWYGINGSEHSSPASSILWPYLMAAFPSAVREYAPFLVNTVFCLLSVNLLTKLIDAGGELKPILKASLVVLLAFGLNWFGLIFTGLEHTAQVFLTVYIALCVVRGWISWWLVVALVTLPLIRYEGLAITLSVSAYLFFTGHAKKALAAALLSVALVGLFSLYLASLGLPYLPSSVVAKAAQPTGNLTGIAKNIKLNLKPYGCVLLLLTWIAYSMRKTPWRFILVVCNPVGAFLALGQIGWFGRYEVFILSYISVFALFGMEKMLDGSKALSTNTQAHWVYGVIGLALAFPGVSMCTLQTPAAASDVWHQQWIMGDLAAELDEPIAVNDLGLVSLRSHQYILDLWGLGSFDALKARATGQAPDWIRDLMRRRQVSYAFVYDQFFPVLPPEWIRVGELRLKGGRPAVSSNLVTLYAVDLIHAERLGQVLRKSKHLKDKDQQLFLVQ
jgi:hypothetical protein